MTTPEREDVLKDLAEQCRQYADEAHKWACWAVVFSVLGMVLAILSVLMRIYT